MSDAYEPRMPEVGQETRHQVRLGDGQGDNAKLADAVSKLADRVNHDAPGGWHVVEQLRHLIEYGWLPCRFVWHVLVEAVNRFTDHEAKLTKAKAEADKLTAEAEAIRVRAEAEAAATVVTAQAAAEKTRAEAEIARAEAEVKRAEAVCLQAQVGRTDELWKKLMARGMDWQGQVGEDGRGQFVVTKRPPTPPN